MEKKQNSFSNEEKAILERIQTVETSVSNNISVEKRKLLETRYYREFTIDSRIGEVTLNDVFITLEQDERNQLSYHFRWLDEEKGIIEERILIDTDGRVFTSMPEVAMISQNIPINMRNSINKNDKKKEKLRAISEVVTPEQHKKSEAESEQIDDEAQQIQADLVEDGVDVEIGSHRGIKDSQIPEVMPEAFEKGKKYEVAEDRKTGNYIIVAQGPDGKYTKNDKIEPGRTTMKKVYTLGDDELAKESEVPTQSMSVIGHPECEVAIYKGQYGYIDMQTVRVTHCQTKFGRKTQMDGQGKEGKEEVAVTKTLESRGYGEFTHEIAHKIRELEELGVVVENLNEEDLEKLKTLDIDATLEEEADRVKVSKEGFKGYVKRAHGETLNERINDAQETIIKEYMGIDRNR